MSSHSSSGDASMLHRHFVAEISAQLMQREREAERAREILDAQRSQHPGLSQGPHRAPEHRQRLVVEQLLQRFRESHRHGWLSFHSRFFVPADRRRKHDQLRA
jgi:hypothetical protein